MAESPVLYVYYRPDNDDAYPGVPARHITEADWAVFSIQQRRTVEEATTQEGYTRRKVWVHRDLVDETEQERAEREAAERAAREAYERGSSLVRYREFEKVVPGPGEVIVGSADGPVPVKRLLLEPPPGIPRLFPLPGLMENPPTIGAVNTAYPGGSKPSPANATITNARRILPTDADASAYRYFGGHTRFYTEVAWRSDLVVADHITSGSAVPYFTVDFEVDCQKLELLVRNGNQQVHIFVDGERITPSAITVSGSGAPVGIPVDFGSRQTRRITVMCREFWGVMVGPNDTIWRSSYPIGPRVIVVGDSFTEGTGTAGHSYLEGWPVQMGRLMGWFDTWPSGSGGTGYVNAGSTGRTTYGGRVQSDVIAYAPDVVIVSGGINDSSYTRAQVEAAAGSLFDTIRGGVPDAALIVVEPFSPRTPENAPLLDVRAGVEAAVSERGLPYIRTAGWVTGTGTASSPSGSGNADLYTSSDTTHPTTAGHAYLGRRVASAIARMLV